MSDDEKDEMRVQVKRLAKKKCGYEVEKRDDGYYYITTVPTKKSSIQSGDRILEINGVGYLDFKSAKKANELFDMLILDVIPADEEDEEEDDDEEEESSEDEELD